MDVSCSIACYKTHKQVHEDEKGAEESKEQQPHHKRDRPGTTQRLPKVDFTGFERDQDFQCLMVRYQLLDVQLQGIYGLTLEPGPDEARTWNRQPLPGSQDANSPVRVRGRDRSRGDRVRRGHRGGRGARGGLDSVLDERQRGPWTQDKGDKEALAVIKKMREGREGEDDAAEGMREFVELCRLRYGGGGQQAGEHI